MRRVGCLVFSFCATLGVWACGSSSSNEGNDGGAMLSSICGEGQNGTSCSCRWQPPPPQGTTYVSGCDSSLSGGHGVCCRGDGWGSTENSTCTCTEAQTVNCWANVSTSTCECIASYPTVAPSGFSGITECAPIGATGHCCRDADDGGGSAACTCTPESCTAGQTEVAKCEPSATPIAQSCPSGQTSADNCR